MHFSDTHEENITCNKYERIPTNGRRKKRIFGVFKGFFYLYTPQKRRKHDTSLNFAAFFKAAQKWPQKMPQKVPQKANFDEKIGAKTPQAALPQKRRKI